MIIHANRLGMYTVVRAVAGREGWTKQWPRASARSLYECGHPFRKLVLEDNFGWGDGGIDLMCLIEVSRGHPLVSGRH